MRRGVSAIAPLCVVACMLMLLAACGAKKAPPVQPLPPPPPPPIVVERVVPPPPPPPPPPAPVVPDPPKPLTPEEIWARYSVEELNGMKPFEDAFFEFDKSDLSDVARAILQKDADYMRKWPSVVIRVEGHCDGRGTSEYNLALGERRATAIRDYLVGLGVTAARISVLTKGNESPFCTGNDEPCWSLNRRGHFVITAK